MRQVNIMKGNDGEDMQTNKILILTGETNEKLNNNSNNSSDKRQEASKREGKIRNKTWGAEK